MVFESPNDEATTALRPTERGDRSALTVDAHRVERSSTTPVLEIQSEADSIKGLSGRILASLSTCKFAPRGEPLVANH